MKNLSLEKLLDQDFLTAKQQRYVRIVKGYEIIRSKSKPKLVRVYFGDSNSVSYIDNDLTAATIDDLELIRLNLYKFAMFSILEEHAGKIKCFHNVNKIKKILRNEVLVKSRDNFEVIYFSPIEGDQVPHHLTIKAQALFNVMEVLKDEGLI